MKARGYSNLIPDMGRRSPMTLGLIIIAVASYIAFFAGLRDQFMGIVITVPYPKPWTVLTYPLGEIGDDAIGVLFCVLWLYWFCKPVEERDGTLRFSQQFLAYTLLGGMLLVLAGALGFHGWLAGPRYPASCLAMLWCAQNRRSPMSFWGIPITGTIFGVIIALFTLVEAGTIQAGFVIMLGLAVPWLIGAGMLVLPRVKKKEVPFKLASDNNAFLDKVKEREKEREERERLRKLFESSLHDDDKR